MFQFNYIPKRSRDDLILISEVSIACVLLNHELLSAQRSWERSENGKCFPKSCLQMGQCSVFPACAGSVCYHFLAENVKMSYFKSNIAVKGENKLKPSNSFIISIGQMLLKSMVMVISSFQVLVADSCVEDIFGSIYFYGILWHSEYL